jgi:hypothetical protein
MPLAYDVRIRVKARVGCRAKDRYERPAGFEGAMDTMCSAKRQNAQDGGTQISCNERPDVGPDHCRPRRHVCGVQLRGLCCQRPLRAQQRFADYAEVRHQLAEPPPARRRPLLSSPWRRHQSRATKRILQHRARLAGPHSGSACTASCKLNPNQQADPGFDPGSNLSPSQVVSPVFWDPTSGILCRISSVCRPRVQPRAADTVHSTP